MSGGPRLGARRGPSARRRPRPGRACSSRRRRGGVAARRGDPQRPARSRGRAARARQCSGSGSARRSRPRGRAGGPRSAAGAETRPGTGRAPRSPRRGGRARSGAACGPSASNGAAEALAPLESRLNLRWRTPGRSPRGWAAGPQQGLTRARRAKGSLRPRQRLPRRAKGSLRPRQRLPWRARGSLRPRLLLGARLKDQRSRSPREWGPQEAPGRRPPRRTKRVRSRSRASPFVECFAPGLSRPEGVVADGAQPPRLEPGEGPRSDAGE